MIDLYKNATDETYRFFLLDFGDEIRRRTIEKIIKIQEENIKKIQEEKNRRKQSLIEKGVCEFCGNENVRYDNKEECILCYECHIDNLKNWASVMVPMRSLDSMEGYMSEEEWNEGTEIN